jgi:hypothetical protein
MAWPHACVGLYMRRVIQACALFLALGVIVAACSSIPAAETKKFSDAVKAVSSASTPLFDNLTIAERELGKNRARRRNPTTRIGGSVVLTSYTVSDAYYFATIGESPSVLIFKRSFDTIQAYCDLLVALADNKSADETQAQLTGLATAAAALAGAVGLAAASGGAALAVLPQVVGELQIPIAQALAAKNAAEARRLVVEGAPLFRNLISTLRSAAPSMFGTLTQRALRSVSSTGQSPTAAADAEAAATQVANYIVLLDQLQLAFDVMLEAYQNPGDPFTLARIAELSTAIAADATAFRKAYTTYRR